MIIVDNALQKRLRDRNPIRAILVGAGYSGRTIAHQILNSCPGIRLLGISDRTLEAAASAYHSAGVGALERVDSILAFQEAARRGAYAVTDDASILCRAEGVEVVIEATGTIDFGAGVVLDAIQHSKHVVLINAELDATLGPILKSHADRSGVVLSDTDGDEPGVAMNMLRFVKSIGLEPVVAGNLKGLYDPYRTPETQKGFAERMGQKASTMTSFADGTKLSMELTVLANAAGFGVGRRGMYGPKLKHVNEAAAFYSDKLVAGGIVDFLEGAAPSNGAFVVARTEDPVKKDNLKYLKMGDGPLYVFYTPFHLPQLEIPNTVARVVLFGDAAATPLGRPFCDAIAVAKRDLAEGEILDGIGGFTCYTLIENAAASRQQRLLPMGVSEGCKLRNEVPKDRALTYDDVELPPGRLCDRLREEQWGLFDDNLPGSALTTGHVV